MNCQVGELTTRVLALTEKLSSGNREKNGSNVQRVRTPSHSDNHNSLGFHTSHMHNK